ncbi:MAG: ribonuclease P [Candidatus Micrarchaeia archaeon]
MNVKQVAYERAGILLSLARRAWACGKADRARRYVRLARRLGTRFLLRFPRRVKLAFCRRCSAPWIHGSTLRVRLLARERVAEYACLACGYTKRFPYPRARRRS